MIEYLSIIHKILEWSVMAPFFMVGIFALGFSLWRWLFPETTKDWSLLAAFVLGVGASSVYLNSVALLFGWAVAAWTLFLIGFICLCDLLRHWKRMEDGEEWKAIRRFGIFLALFLVLVSLLSMYFDEEWHLSLSSVISNGLWLAPHITNPDLPLRYHFGFDIVSGAIAYYGWPVMVAEDLLQAFLQSSLVGLIWFFFRKQGLTPMKAAIGTYLALLFGSLARLTWYLRFLFPALSDALVKYSEMWFSILIISYRKSNLFVIGFLVLILCIARSKPALRVKRAFLLAPLAMAAVSISCEVSLVFFFPFVFLAVMTEARRAKDVILIILAGCAGLALSIIQGGLLGDAVRSFLDGTHGQNQYSTFVLGSSFQSWFVFSHWWLRLAVAVIGPILLGVMAFAGFRKLPSFYRWLLTGSLVCTVIPFFVQYPASPGDFLRIWTLPFLVFIILGISSLFAKLTKRRQFILAVMLMCLFTFGNTLSFVQRSIPLPQISYYVPNWMPPNFWPSLVWRNDFLPRNSVIWVDPTATYRHMAILAFGVPIQICEDFIAKDQTQGPRHAFVSDKCKDFEQDPSEQSLKALGVTHLLLSDDYIKRHMSDPWFSGIELQKNFPFPAWAKFIPSYYWKDLRHDWALYKLKTD